MDGHLEIVRLLCKHSPDLESVNNEGKTSLMVALSYGYGGIATHLIWAGA
jgi:ankyrin repeat protein